MLRIYKVTGDSMHPTLTGNDYVITSQWLAIKKNRLVVVEHAVYKRLVKRIIDICDNGEIQLAGDNPASLSSTQMGSFTKSQILGVVLFCIKAKT